MTSKAFSPRKEADRSITTWCHSSAIAVCKMHSQKSLTPRWCSFLGHSSDVVATIFDSKGGVLFDYEWMLQRNHLDCPWCYAKNRCRSVDAHLWVHISDILTVIRCSSIVQKIHTVFFGSQYTVSMYYHLNQKSSKYLSFWATTIHVICIMNDESPLHFSAFSLQFTAWKSMH